MSSARRILGPTRYAVPCVLTRHGSALRADSHEMPTLGYAMGVVKTCDETIDPRLLGVTLDTIMAVHRFADETGREPDGEVWRAMGSRRFL